MVFTSNQRIIVRNALIMYAKACANQIANLELADQRPDTVQYVNPNWLNDARTSHNNAVQMLQHPLVRELGPAGDPRFD